MIAQMEEKGMTREQAQIEAFYATTEVREVESWVNRQDFWNTRAGAARPIARWNASSDFNEFHACLCPGASSRRQARPLHGLRRALLPVAACCSAACVSAAARCTT